MTLMSMPGGSSSIKMSGLRSIFRSEESSYMVAETIKKYALDSAEAAYENTEE